MKSVTLYTRPACAYCDLIKKFLNMKGVKYQVIDIETNKVANDKVMALTGRTIVPTTVVEKTDGTQEIVVGFNLSKLAPAISD